MKKIISMICVIAMMFSFAVMSASAANNSVTLVKNEEASLESGKLAFDVVVANSDGVKSVTLQLSYADFLAKNAMGDGDFTATKVSATTANPTAAKDFIVSTYTNTDGAHKEVTMMTVFVNPENFKNDASFALTNVSKVDGVTLAAGLATNNFAIAAPGSDEEEESNIVATSDREAVTEKATHQIGTAVGMTVTVPDGITFQKMIWVIANGSERLYSQEKIDLSDLSVSGDIRVAATFVNGSHNDVYADAEVVAPLTIGENDFDAIFTDGTNDYFTNEADVKAE